MGDEFEELYKSRCKFTRRYIDCLVMSKGKSSFIWSVFCRAGRFYNNPFVFSLPDVERHLNSKISYYERQIINAEKEKRTGTTGRQSLKDNTARVAKFSRIMDVLTLRMCGYTYRQIGEELGMSRDTARQLLLTARGCGYRGEIKYLFRVLKEIKRL